jgi:hypothetical protein
LKGTAKRGSTLATIEGSHLQGFRQRHDLLAIFLSGSIEIAQLLVPGRHTRLLLRLTLKMSLGAE